MAVAGGLVDVAGQLVVEHDDAGPVGVLLGVDEVAQDVLEQVHAIDERQVDPGVTEMLQGPRTLEEVVARRLTMCRSHRSSVTTLKAGSTATVGTLDSVRLRPSLIPISK